MEVKQPWNNSRRKEAKVSKMEWNQISKAILWYRNRRSLFRKIQRRKPNELK